jgi:hypothetical protein
MAAARLRPVVRLVTLAVATIALTLSGGAPSWTDSLTQSQPAEGGR